MFCRCATRTTHRSRSRSPRTGRRQRMPTLQRMMLRGADREQIAGEEHDAEQQHAFVQKGSKATSPAATRQRPERFISETAQQPGSDFGSRVLGSTRLRGRQSLGLTCRLVAGGGVGAWVIQHRRGAWQPGRVSALFQAAATGPAGTTGRPRRDLEPAQARAGGQGDGWPSRRFLCGFVGQL